MTQADRSLTRRNALKLLGGGTAGMALPGILTRRACAADEKRPNIIVILADDMGFSDLQCYGSEISTPNLDRMAKGGVRFTQFYNCARCCPTRASLLTGLYPHQAGVGHMIDDCGLPSYQGYLNDRCVTIAEAIRPAGYTPVMTGKWHVGEKQPHWPMDRGFEDYYGLISGASNYFKLDEGRTFVDGNEPVANLGKNFYMTDAFSNNAVKQIEEYGKKEEPFFLYLAYTAPHWPLHAHPQDIEKYTNRYIIGWESLREWRYKNMVEMGIVDPRWELPPRDEEAPGWRDESVDRKWENMRMAVYAAQIDCMDRGIGQILEKLRELEIEDNTLILFLADNGGCAESRPENKPDIMPGPSETFQSYGLAWANASNTPFRRYKHWVHEGGIATPCIAYYPGHIPAGQISHQPGHVMDILPTCLDYAGAEYPKTFHGNEITPVEGKSLRPILEGRERSGHPAIFWEHEGNRAVRQGKWKLVSQHAGPWELYDLEADRTEMQDQAEAEPERVKTMIALYEDWAARVGVQPWKDIQERKKSEKEDRKSGKSESKNAEKPNNQSETGNKKQR